jgi:hypothetical protein
MAALALLAAIAANAVARIVLERVFMAMPPMFIKKFA